MSHETPPARARRERAVQGEKLRGARKVEHIPIKVIPSTQTLRKPSWIRVRMPTSPAVKRIKDTLRKHKLSSVCELPQPGGVFQSGYGDVHDHGRYLYPPLSFL